MKRNLIAILCFGVIFQCRNSDTDASLQEYRRRVLFALVLSPAPNPIETCETALNRMQACVVQSKTPPPVVNESTLAPLIGSNLIPNSRPTTYNALCQDVMATSLFRNASDRAKSCLIDCYRKQWDARENSGACRSQSFASLLSTTPLNDPSCVLECQRITNSNNP